MDTAIKNIIIPLFLSFSISAVSVPLIIRFSRKYNIFDPIDHRKIHKGKISRLGGIAVFMGFMAPFIFFAIFAMPRSRGTVFVTSAIVLAFVTGFIDDIFHIRTRYKLILQALCGILIAKTGLCLRQIDFQPYLQIDFGIFSIIITVFIVVLFMNAINLIDGIDGLASGIVLIAAIFIAIIAITKKNEFAGFLSIILAGAVAGFYIYNFPPARIFMGDSGAYFLGIMLAVLTLASVKKAAVLTNAIVPLTLLLIPLWDIPYVILARLKKKENIFFPDNTHIHHRMMSIGFSQKVILTVVYTSTILLGIASLVMIQLSPAQSLILFFVLIGKNTILFFILAKSRDMIKNRNSG